MRVNARSFSLLAEYSRILSSRDADCMVQGGVIGAMSLEYMWREKIVAEALVNFDAAYDSYDQEPPA